MPAKKAVIAGRAGQKGGVARKNLVADGRQAFAKDLADVWMAPSPPHDAGYGVGMDVADRQLVEVRCEPAARLDLAARVDD
jgi:hypothetical protein